MTFNGLLVLMVEKKASDLHLIAGLYPAFRINGELQPLTEFERFTPESLKEFVYSILTTHQKNIFENDPLFRNELDFAYGIPGLGRFRFNVHVSRIVDVFPMDQQPQVRTQLASNILGVISQVLLPRKDHSGRIMACEVMLANSAIRNNIRAGKVEAIYQTLQTSAAEGMQTMDQCLIRLSRERKIDYEAAKPYIFERTTHETIKALDPSARPSCGLHS